MRLNALKYQTDNNFKFLLGYMNGKDCSVLKNIHGIWSSCAPMSDAGCCSPLTVSRLCVFLLPASLNLIRKGLLRVIGTFAINPGKNKGAVAKLQDIMQLTNSPRGAAAERRCGPRTHGRVVCRIHSGKPSGKVPRSRPEMSEATRRLRAAWRLRQAV